jgi:hypothetical protein
LARKREQRKEGRYGIQRRDGTPEIEGTQRQEEMPQMRSTERRREANWPHEDGVEKPEVVMKTRKKKVRKWIQGEKGRSGAVKHPGALTEAAKRHGRSKVEEARIESHSTDPHIRGRGILGLRFMGKAKHGNIHRKKSRSQGR